MNRSELKFLSINFYFIVYSQPIKKVLFARFVRRKEHSLFVVLKHISFRTTSPTLHTMVKSVQSALSDLERPPERLQSQCNYRLFIT